MADSTSGKRWFQLGCVLELALLAAAIVLARLLGLPLFGMVVWSLEGVLLGILATAPMFGVFGWVCYSSWEPLAAIREFIEVTLGTAFAGWSWWQIGTIALLAGVAEECFFRGVLQTQLTQWLGPSGAVLLVSLAFGAFHSITLAYAVLTALVGAYLGWLWLWSGNLLVPILAHGIYDLVVLGYCLRWKGKGRTE